MNNSILSYALAWPFLSVLLVLFIPAGMGRLLKIVLSGSSAVLLAIIVLVVMQFDPGLPADQTWLGYQLVEKSDWITLNLQAFGTLSVDYLVGVDGLNLALLALTGLVIFIASVSSWTIENRIKGYVLCFLLISGSIVGCFVALDFFLFFIFFEFMLLPMFFLIGLWGGQNKEYAALKFFLYTLAGSVFILMTMIALYMSMIDPVETAIQFGLMKPGEMLTNEVIFEVQQLLASGSIPAEQIVHTFSIPYLSDASNLIPHSILSFESESRLWGIPMRNWGFFALVLGFLIKLPSAPLHTWLPDAHVEAPTAVSVLLAGLVLKVGAYGLLRIVLPVFPEMLVQYAFPLAAIGLFSIWYGALNALGSPDLKKLVAYSSVSHMGFVLLGISALTAEGITGAVYQTISHGLISPLLFILTGVIYDRVQNRNRDQLNGLVKPMPVYVALFMLAFFAAMGIPGFSGFIAEILVIIGAFKSSGFNQIIPRWVAILSTGGLFLSAAYSLYTARKMFFGPLQIPEQTEISAFKDLNIREYLMVIPLLLLILLLGIFPSLLIEYINPVVEHLTLLVEGK